VAAFILPGHATDAGLKVFEVLVQVHHTLDQCSNSQNRSSVMPVSLLALANELLLLIANSLDSERSINAVARTNRRLYHLLNDYLYKHNVIKGGSSALWWAAKCGQSGSVAKSIAQAGNINVRWNGYLKLRQLGYLASIDSEARVVDLLKRNRCLYCTPIYLAILSGHEKVADLLIRNGADIESCLGPWANPLQAAAQCGQLQSVQRLAARGDVDKPAPHKGRTALHIACLEGNDMIVQHLIEAGANVMGRDDELDTPLHIALKDREASQFSSRCLRTVQWLLISGADMHARNRKGQTPVSMAMQIKGSDLGCLFKKGSRIAVYEAGFQSRQPGYRSTSLQRLWAAYLDKQNEAAIEASRAKRIQAEATARKESAKKRLQMQQEREARRRHAENQKQVEEKLRKEREQRAQALRKQEEDQQHMKVSLSQKQDALRRVWHDLKAKAECVNQPTDSVAKGGSVDCKHAALTWKRRKGKVDCAFCHRAFAKCFFFVCPDCGTSVCQSCTRRSGIPG
jgi:ankyrin repeat protein